MIPPDEALRLVLANAQSAAPRTLPWLDTIGLRLAQAVRADRDYPPFDRAMMDGYAARVADAGQAVELAGQVVAGQAGSVSVQPRQCVEVMTGAACPPGTEAVVPKEEVTCEAGQVVLPAVLRSLQHLAVRGSECRAGTEVLAAGQPVTPLAIAVLASVGLRQVSVYPAPTLGIVTTGEELIEHAGPPELGQIRDSNGPMLVAMARTLGLEPPLLLHAGDQVDAILASLEQLADRDLIVLTGGVSTGRYDLVPDSLVRFGAEVVFHKVSQKPGKPLLFARRGHQLVFGLPGNPLAAHLCFHRYVSAAVRRLAGWPTTDHSLRGELAAAVRPNKTRTSFILGHAEANEASESGWRLQPLPGVSSADIFGPCRANGYLHVPPGDEPLAEGETLSFEWLATPSPP